MELVLIGLFLIAAGWIIQLYSIIKGNKDINVNFLILYLIGAILLFINDLLAGSLITGLLNVISAIIPLIIVFLLIKKN